MTYCNQTNCSLNFINKDVKLFNLNHRTLIAIISFTVLFDILTLATLLKTKARLIRTEYFIILCVNIFSTFIKLAGILKNIAPLVNSISICLISYALDSDVIFCYLMIFLFYALYHFSIIKRTPTFRLVFHLVHNPRNFLVYMATITLGFTIFIFAYAIALRNEIFIDTITVVNKTTNNNHTQTSIISTINCNPLNKYAIIPLLSYLCSLLSPLLYLVAIFELRFCTITRSETRSLAKRSSSLLWKKLNVSVKFLIFSLTCFMVTVPRLMITLYGYILEYYNVGVYFSYTFNWLFLIFFSIQTLVLMFINNKLRRSFFRLFLEPMWDFLSCRVCWKKRNT